MIIDNLHNLSELSAEEKKKIAEKNVLIIGAGGIGNIVVQQLARYDLNITVIDADYVDFSNLSRQLTFSKEDAEQKVKKVVALKREIKRLVGKDISIIDDMYTEKNKEIINNADLIIEGSDDYKTKFLLNSQSVAQHKRIVITVAAGMKGLVFSYDGKKESSSFSDLFAREPKEFFTTCDLGVLNNNLLITAGCACTQAVKLLIERDYLQNKVWIADVWKDHYEILHVKKK